jgi:serine/threonine protein kinase
MISILEKIHAKNIIHRDLKPQNIMFDNHNKIYSVDFGISKEIGKKNLIN